jgi:hypothetical protein
MRIAHGGVREHGGVLERCHPRERREEIEAEMRKGLERVSEMIETGEVRVHQPE